MARMVKGKHTINLFNLQDGDPIEDRAPTRKNRFYIALVILFPILVVVIGLALLLTGNEKAYFPTLLTICGLFLVVFTGKIIVADLRRKFKLDMTTETLTWYENFGRTKTCRFISEVSCILVTEVREKIYPAKSPMYEIIAYEVGIRDKSDQLHPILREDTPEKAENIAQAMADLMHRPVQQQQLDSVRKW